MKDKLKTFATQRTVGYRWKTNSASTEKVLGATIHPLSSLMELAIKGVIKSNLKHSLTYTIQLYVFNGRERSGNRIFL